MDVTVKVLIEEGKTEGVLEMRNLPKSCEYDELKQYVDMGLVAFGAFHEGLEKRHLKKQY